MSHSAIRVTLVGALCAATAAPTQTVPVTTLGQPLAEFPEGYASLSGLRELPDGRVMTIEQCERVVKLLDLGSGVEGLVGRTGGGPGEYRSPSRLFALPGDSSAIDDGGNRRFLVIAPDGRPAGFFNPLPPTTVIGTSGVASTGFAPTGADSLGRLYGTDGGIAEIGGSFVRADSLAIVRWDRRGGRRDTLAFYRNPRAGPVVRSTPETPFRPATLWAVARDGRVALVHPGDYHVEFIGPTGTRSIGALITYERVRVSEGHQKQWREDLKPPCGRGAGPRTFKDSDGRTVTFVDRPTPEPAEWPGFLPPFLTGAAVFAPDGLLWVRRTVAADAPPAYDLIDRRGILVRGVVLPKRTRLLGFGRASVYLVRVDDDDLQYLQRYPLPRP